MKAIVSIAKRGHEGGEKSAAPARPGELSQ